MQKNNCWGDLTYMGCKELGLVHFCASLGALTLTLNRGLQAFRACGLVYP